eukprot:TRINITY_DN15026_c0_g1::TRINITY_DN15026_c0_g1_i1::g.25785::m.25785 TRINITY_DN15026_c0_g1::TRINITY_DN15026_c0_g1_i1::g.25785  ORF type:complete len:131 (-),score=14.98,DUF603/PF04645.7/0.13 TRINITY_DN15026_c0_g1_i1:242-634(-)
MAMRGASDPQFSVNAITGHPSQVIESLTRSVAQYCRDDSNVTKMYIGIGSGPDALSALKTRLDDYKKENGINDMIALYESSSQDNCRTVEDWLVSYFEEHKRCINRTGGGGGRESSQTKFYVYLALRRWG